MRTRCWRLELDTLRVGVKLEVDVRGEGGRRVRNSQAISFGQNPRPSIFPGYSFFRPLA